MQSQHLHRQHPQPQCSIPFSTSAQPPRPQPPRPQPPRPQPPTATTTTSSSSAAAPAAVSQRTPTPVTILQQIHDRYLRIPDIANWLLDRDARADFHVVQNKTAVLLTTDSKTPPQFQPPNIDLPFPSSDDLTFLDHTRGTFAYGHIWTDTKHDEHPYTAIAHKLTPSCSRHWTRIRSRKFVSDTSVIGAVESVEFTWYLDDSCTVSITRIPFSSNTPLTTIALVLFFTPTDKPTTVLHEPIFSLFAYDYARCLKCDTELCSCPSSTLQHRVSHGHGREVFHLQTHTPSGKVIDVKFPVSSWADRQRLVCRGHRKGVRTIVLNPFIDVKNRVSMRQDYFAIFQDEHTISARIENHITNLLSKLPMQDSMPGHLAAIAPADALPPVTFALNVPPPPAKLVDTGNLPKCGPNNACGPKSRNNDDNNNDNNNNNCTIRTPGARGEKDSKRSQITNGDSPTNINIGNTNTNANRTTTTNVDASVNLSANVNVVDNNANDQSIASIGISSAITQVADDNSSWQSVPTRRLSSKNQSLSPPIGIRALEAAAATNATRLSASPTSIPITRLQGPLNDATAAVAQISRANTPAQPSTTCGPEKQGKDCLCSAENMPDPALAQLLNCKFSESVAGLNGRDAIQPTVNGTLVSAAKTGKAAETESGTEALAGEGTTTRTMSGTETTRLPSKKRSTLLHAHQLPSLIQPMAKRPKPNTPINSNASVIPASPMKSQDSLQLPFVSWNSNEIRDKEFGGWNVPERPLSALSRAFSVLQKDNGGTLGSAAMSVGTNVGKRPCPGNSLDFDLQPFLPPQLPNSMLSGQRKTENISLDEKLRRQTEDFSDIGKPAATNATRHPSHRNHNNNAANAAHLQQQLQQRQKNMGSKGRNNSINNNNNNNSANVAASANIEPNNIGTSIPRITPSTKLIQQQHHHLQRHHKNVGNNSNNNSSTQASSTNSATTPGQSSPQQPQPLPAQPAQPVQQQQQQQQQQHQQQQQQQQQQLQQQVACEICGIKFAKRGNKMRHIMTVHKQMKEFQCDVCGTKFGLKADLARHRYRIHESRSFSCPTCGKSFAEESQLETHVKVTHEEDSRPWECKICHIRFGRKSSLTRHEQTVHQHTRFECSICKKSYSQRFDAIRHERKVHGLDDKKSGVAVRQSS